MKKLFFKMLVAVLIMLSVPYIYLGGGFQMPDFLSGLFSTSNEKKSLNASSVKTDQDVTVYKWVDEHGHTHFGGKPPVGHVAEAVELRADTNVMKAVTPVEEEDEEESLGGKIISLGQSPNGKSDKDKAEDGGLPGEVENPYSPDGLQQLIENAKNVGKALEQRQKMLDGSSGE